MSTYVTLRCYGCEAKIPHHVPSPITDRCPNCDSEYFEILEVD